MTKNGFKILMVFIALFTSCISYATEADDAKIVASKIINLMSSGKYAKVYDSHMSLFFKSKMTRDSWLANLSIGRQMLGSFKNKKFVDMSYSDNDSASGYQGSVYAFTYLNTYSGMKLYEKVVVINENGEGFKLAGFWASSAQQ